MGIVIIIIHNHFIPSPPPPPPNKTLWYLNNYNHSQINTFHLINFHLTLLYPLTITTTIKSNIKFNSNSEFKHLF